MAKKLTFKKKKTKEGERARESSRHEFPKISRFIPEKTNEVFIFLVALVFFLVCSGIVAYDLYQNIKLETKLVGQTSELQRRLSFWESEVQKHPDFRDAYYNLALINYQLKDLNSARVNLDKALNIDPNFEKGRKLEEILTGSF